MEKEIKDKEVTQDKKHIKNFVLFITITVILMAFHLFIREIMTLKNPTIVWVGWLLGILCRRLFNKLKHRIIFSTIVFFSIIYLLFKEFIDVPAYILIFTMIFILLIDEIIKSKSKFIKVEIIATVILFICFFSFNYYLSSTRLIKSLNLNKIIAKQNYFIDEINKENLLKVSSLSINDSQFGVTDLTGLEHLENLQKLSIDDNGTIEDYSPIQELKKLNMFSTWRADLDKLEELKEMKSVETLDIAYPEKGQLDSLKSFPNLKVLYFQGGELSDITTLQGSKKLTRLTVAYCKVRDFEGIEYFENLQEIFLYNLNIDDPCKLLSLKELKNISLQDCKVNDLESFKSKAEELGVFVNVTESVRIP